MADVFNIKSEKCVCIILYVVCPYNLNFIWFNAFLCCLNWFFRQLNLYLDRYLYMYTTHLMHYLLCNKVCFFFVSFLFQQLYKNTLTTRFKTNILHYTLSLKFWCVILMCDNFLFFQLYFHLRFNAREKRFSFWNNAIIVAYFAWIICKFFGVM